MSGHGHGTSERAADEQELAAEDLAWRARRSTIAPIAFGVIGMAASPLLLGLVCGPIGLRAGIDLWRSGVRRAGVALGVAASLLAIVLSVIAAVLWGSVLAGVLLTRDALRETERWIGKPVRAVEFDALVLGGDAAGGDGGTHLEHRTLAPAADESRLVLVFITPGHPASDGVLRALAELVPAHPSVGIVVASIDANTSAESLRQSALASGLRAPAIRPETKLPPPIDAVAITPTVVVIGRDGRIESAASGGRPGAELDRMLGGGVSASTPPAR